MDIEKEKPHLSTRNSISSEASDIFSEKRISDLLPDQIIRQIGFDPDQFIFKTSLKQKMMRRPSYSGFIQFDPAPVPSRRNSQIVDLSILSPEMSSPLQTAKAHWYVVDLGDFTVDAYSVKPINCTSGGVIVSDGYYLRYGRIQRVLKEEPLLVQSDCFPIVGTDTNGAIGDFVTYLSMIAKEIIPNLITVSKASCEFVSVETVSYQARALMRVKVSNADDPRLSFVANKLVLIFGVPVEIYDDFSG